MQIDTLIGDRSTEWDWDSIVNIDINGSTKKQASYHTSKDCELQWKNNCHPTLKQSNWTKDEDAVRKTVH